MTPSMLILIGLSSMATQSSTPSIHERIKFLKQKLEYEFHRHRITPDLKFDEDTSREDDSSIHRKEFLIRPIAEVGRKPKRIKFTTTNNNDTSVKNTAKTNSPKAVKGNATKSHGLRTAVNASLATNKKKSHLEKPIAIFYRRILDEENRDMEWKWTQCHDMITPFLNGIRKDAEVIRKVSLKDPIVERLFQLLTINTTTYDKEETYSVLYQISTLQLRLSHWDLMPVRGLLNIIIRGKSHTFKNLKHGLKLLFKIWRLDLSDLSNILKQTRIIRPPCTVTSRYSGSTKSQKVSKLKDWMTSPTTKCEDEEFECNGDE